MDCFSDYVYTQLLGNSVIWIVLLIETMYTYQIMMFCELCCEYSCAVISVV